MEDLQALSSIAETVSIVGVLLLWVYAERSDNRKLWRILFKGKPEPEEEED